MSSQLSAVVAQPLWLPGVLSIDRRKNPLAAHPIVRARAAAMAAEMLH